MSVVGEVRTLAGAAGESSGDGVRMEVGVWKEEVVGVRLFVLAFAWGGRR